MPVSLALFGRRSLGKESCSLQGRQLANFSQLSSNRGKGLRTTGVAGIDKRERTMLQGELYKACNERQGKERLCAALAREGEGDGSNRC